jgi:catalase
VVSGEKEGGYVHYQEKVEGRVTRARSESFNDHYSQATLFWNSMSEPEKEHIVRAFQFELGKVGDMDTRKRIVDMFNNVDGKLARRVAEAIGVPPPETPGGTGVTKSSAALSFTSFPAPGIKTRRIAVLGADGFNNAELTQVTEMFEEEGAVPEIVSLKAGMISSAGGEKVAVDHTFLTTASVMYDALFIPGGVDSAEALGTSPDAVRFINDAYKHCKVIGAMSEGIDALKKTDARMAVRDTGGEDNIVSDLGIVIVRHPSQMEGFVETFVEEVRHHRHWMREPKIAVPA